MDEVGVDELSATSQLDENGLFTAVSLLALQSCDPATDGIRAVGGATLGHLYVQRCQLVVAQPYGDLRRQQQVAPVLPWVMDVVGLRELRQQASELVRRVEAGEEVTITVAGRPSARLVPVAPRTWRQWRDVAELFSGPADPEWATEQDLIDGSVRDPWTE